MNILMGSILNVDRDMNGVVVSAKELQDQLLHSGHSVALISPYSVPYVTLLSWTESLGAKFARFFGTSYITLLNLAIKALILTFRSIPVRKDYQYFHAHDIITAMVFLLVTNKSNIVILHTHFHDSPWNEFVSGGFLKRNSPSFSLFKYLCTKTLSQKRLNLLHVSRSNQEFVQNLLPLENRPSHVLYPGLSVSSDGIKSFDGDYIINVGSLDSRKRQIVLIEMLFELEKLGLSYPLLLVGPEQKQEKMRLQTRMQELQIKSPVYFMGEQKKSITRSLIKSARLYVQTSTQESFGRTIMEAMFLKTPVVAFWNHAVLEILTDQAILDPCRSITKNASTLYRLLTNKAIRSDLQAKQYNSFIQKFTANQMIEKYSLTLQQLGSAA